MVDFVVWFICVREELDIDFGDKFDIGFDNFILEIFFDVNNIDDEFLMIFVKNKVNYNSLK